MTKQKKALIVVLSLLVVLSADVLIVYKIARASFAHHANENMNYHASLRTVEFEASMNEQLTLVRQLVNRFSGQAIKTRNSGAAWNSLM